jgi:hypothetical protein
MENRTPVWEVNIYDANAYGVAEAEPGALQIAVYDANISVTEPVHSRTFTPMSPSDIDDEWVGPDELLTDASSDIFDADHLAEIDAAVTQAEEDHSVWAQAMGRGRRDNVAETVAVARAAAGWPARVAAGVPAGGQFTGRDRAESAIAL